MTDLERKVAEAMSRQEPKRPQVIELGGGYYYKCHWITCSTDVNRYMDYCPKCGQRIEWEGI